VLHSDSSSYSAFSSIIFVPSPVNQLRVTGSARQDNYQVPNIVAQQAMGIDDNEKATTDNVR